MKKDINSAESMMSAEMHDISVLNDYQHFRLRLEMYMGSRVKNQRWVLLNTRQGPVIQLVECVPAVMTAIREIIDNSLDEFTKANIGGTLMVSYNEELAVFEVSDNGRGIPIDWDQRYNCTLAELVLTQSKAGRNFNDAERKGTGGMNGLGGSAVANCSDIFEVEIIRSGMPFGDPSQREQNASYTGNWLYRQSFSSGDDALAIEPYDVEKTSNKVTGTTIRFQLSKAVFPDLTLPASLVESLLRDIAVANPHHKIYFNGSKMPTGTADRVLFQQHKTIQLHVQGEGFKSSFFLIPNLTPVEHGLMTHSLVNNIPTIDEG